MPGILYKSHSSFAQNELQDSCLQKQKRLLLRKQ